MVRLSEVEGVLMGVGEEGSESVGVRLGGSVLEEGGESNERVIEGDDGPCLSSRESSIPESSLSGDDDPWLSSRDPSSSVVGDLKAVELRGVQFNSASSLVCVESESGEGVMFRIWSREQVVKGNDDMLGDCIVSIAGNMPSRNSQSPVTRIR